MKRIDDKVNSRPAPDGPPGLRKGPAGSDPAPLPHGCHPSAWTLECPGAEPFRIPLCGLLAGRSLVCDLVLDDPDISRRHVQFTLLDAKIWIVDLGSANGTLVDGALVRRERLREGSEIALGSVRLLLRSARLGDLPLPGALWDDWRSVADGPSTRDADRLRRLAGAQSCTWAEGGHPVLQWPDNGRWEDLGPVRRHLVEASSTSL